MDQALLKDQILGYEAALTRLRGEKDLFVKAQGLNEQAEKLRQDAELFLAEIKTEKENQKTLVAEKNKVLQTVTGRITTSMNAVLPYGYAALNIDDDGSVLIGWDTGNAIVPYSGLSGGEKASFEPALCKALGGSIILSEAAEVDNKHLTDALRKYKEAGIQCIVSTCHSPEIIPDGWNVVKL